jgi:hypothetical protein
MEQGTENREQGTGNRELGTLLQIPRDSSGLWDFFNGTDLFSCMNQRSQFHLSSQSQEGSQSS